MRPALIRRTQSGRVDFAFVLYDGDRKTHKLAVAMPMPGKLLWSITLCDLDNDADLLAQLKSATRRASFELKEVPGAALEPCLGPLMPNGSRRYVITTMSGRGWYTHYRILAPRSSQSVVDGACATIAVR